MSLPLRTIGTEEEVMTTTTSRRHALEFRHNPDKSEGWPAFPFLSLIRPTEQEAPDDLEVGV